MAALSQRGQRHKVKLTGDQLYETPPCATRALVRHEPFTGPIWEPCAGRGAIVRELEAYGYEVVASELNRIPGQDPGIQTGIDFFTLLRPPARVSAIITNPPFKDADRFVRHALKLVPKVVVLLRLAALEGAGRADLIEGHLVRLWIGKERLPMMHRDGWAGNRLNQTAAPFAWFVFELHPALQGQGFLGRRISWREGGHHGQEAGDGSGAHRRRHAQRGERIHRYDQGDA